MVPQPTSTKPDIHSDAQISSVQDIELKKQDHQLVVQQLQLILHPHQEAPQQKLGNVSLPIVGSSGDQGVKIANGSPSNISSK